MSVQSLRAALDSAESEVASWAQELHVMDHCSECAGIADSLAALCERMRAALDADAAEAVS